MTRMAETTKFLLSEDAIPTHWVNLLPDLPGEPLPPLNPQTGSPPGRRPHADLPDGADHAGGLARAGDRDPGRRSAMPTGCGARRRCSARAGWSRRSIRRRTSTTSTRASPPPARTSRTRRSRRPTRTRRPASRSSCTETGAGQWGSSLAFACSLFGLECEVFMVGSSYDQKPYRRSMMQTWGATVHRSPSDLTSPGRSQAPHPTGSLGIAISEAVEVAAQDEDTQLLARLGAQPRAAAPDGDRAGGDRADGDGGRRARTSSSRCVGGGSNFGGLAFPFLRGVLRGERKTRFVAAEPAACPTLTRGVYALRLRRHGRADAADADVHARPRLRPAAGARRRAALPRRLADGVRAGQGGRGRGARLPPERDVRGRGAVRPHRGDHPGAGAGARDPRGARGGRGGQARPARSA